MTPPPNIVSNSAIPTESRRRFDGFGLARSSPSVREKACSPSPVMRTVCRPGTEAWPRSFMICSLRTTELRSVTCESHRMPSTMVKSGLSRISSWTYSPTRKVVASELVRNWDRRWMNDCTSKSPTALAALRARVRKESTTTTPALAVVTCAMISSNTAFRSFSNTRSERLMKRTAAPTLESSKNENCCW